MDPTGKDEEAALQETPESWRRRQGHEAPLSVREQEEIRAAVQKTLKPLLKIKN